MTRVWWIWSVVFWFLPGLCELTRVSYRYETPSYMFLPMATAARCGGLCWSGTPGPWATDKVAPHVAAAIVCYNMETHVTS